MVFLFIIFILIIFILIIIISSKILIQIDNFKVNFSKNKYVNDNYKIIIILFFFNKIPILKKVYDKNKIKKIENKIDINNKIKKIKMKNIIEELSKNNSANLKLLKSFFKEVLEIINARIKIELGTKDAALTAILVGTVTTIISVFLRTKIKDIEKQYYNIIPRYINQNIIDIEFSGIFGFKVIHIINIIYILFKEKQ